MTSKIGPKEQELRQQREASAKKWFAKPGSLLAKLLTGKASGVTVEKKTLRDHPANIETEMLYGKTQTMGIVSKTKKKKKK